MHALGRGEERFSPLVRALSERLTLRSDVIRSIKTLPCSASAASRTTSDRTCSCSPPVFGEDITPGILEWFPYATSAPFCKVWYPCKVLRPVFSFDQVSVLDEGGGKIAIREELTSFLFVKLPLCKVCSAAGVIVKFWRGTVLLPQPAAPLPTALFPARQDISLQQVLSPSIW
jgi:hypothetical protein